MILILMSLAAQSPPQFTVTQLSWSRSDSCSEVLGSDSRSYSLCGLLSHFRLEIIQQQQRQQEVDDLM